MRKGLTSERLRIMPREAHSLPKGRKRGGVWGGRDDQNEISSSSYWCSCRYIRDYYPLCFSVVSSLTSVSATVIMDLYVEERCVCMQQQLWRTTNQLYCAVLFLDCIHVIRSMVNYLIHSFINWCSSLWIIYHCNCMILIYYFNGWCMVVINQLLLLLY